MKGECKLENGGPLWLRVRLIGLGRAPSSILLYPRLQLGKGAPIRVLGRCLGLGREWWALEFVLLSLSMLQTPLSSQRTCFGRWYERVPLTCREANIFMLSESALEIWKDKGCLS